MCSESGYARSSYDKVPLSKDGLYCVQRINPETATFDDALQIADITLDTFSDDPIFRYWFGPDYKYDNFVKDVRQTVYEAEDRLKGYIARAKALERLTFAYARSVHLNILSRREDYYGLYSDSKLIGFFNVVYPSSLTKPMFKPMSFSQRLHHDCTALKYMASNWWSFLGTGEHPLNNPRGYVFYAAIEDGTRHIPDTVEEEDRLSKLSYNELIDTPYRTSDYIVLRLFMISREYQRQGLGKLLFEHFLSVLPSDANVEFASKDQLTKSVGPIKESIIASPAGKNLYTKFGFEQVASCYFAPEGKAEFGMTNYRLERQ